MDLDFDQPSYLRYGSFARADPLFVTRELGLDTATKRSSIAATLIVIDAASRAGKRSEPEYWARMAPTLDLKRGGKGKVARARGEGSRRRTIKEIVAEHHAESREDEDGGGEGDDERSVGTKVLVGSFGSSGGGGRSPTATASPESMKGDNPLLALLMMNQVLEETPLLDFGAQVLRCCYHHFPSKLVFTPTLCASSQ